MNREKARIEWVLMNMRLSGSSMNEETTSQIAGGQYVLNATLEEHLLVAGLTEILPLFEALLGMGEELCVDTLRKFYKVFSDGKPAVYRKTTPVLFHLSYNPVLPQEIEEELSALFRRLYRHPVGNALERAVFVHNELIRIYPFDDCNELVARAAMEYELLYQGKFMCPLTLTESEYNSALAEYMKKGKETAILENLRLNQLMVESRVDTL